MAKKSILEKLKPWGKKIGPGLITGASDDDPSGIATYSQAGAVLGLKLLWAALLTYPLMYAIQAMCARIGIITSSGLIGAIRKYYSPLLAWAAMAFIIPAIVFNIAADLASMGAILNILVPQIPSFMFDILIIIISMGYMFFCRYNSIANVFKFFCLALLCYFIVPFLVQEDWRAVFYATFIPHFEWNQEYIYLLVAVLGTTISPYLFFWQASLSHEEKQQDNSTKKSAIDWMKLDVNLGMLASNLAMYFVILTTASVLHTHGISKINTVEEAALTLKPLAGEFAFVVFAIGILGVGFLAIPVLSGCIGYMFAECFHWPNGLDKVPRQAPAFYGIIAVSLLIALGINAIGIDPIKALVLTAILYGVITPPILAIILFICNNEKIMGKHVNNFFYNSLGMITIILMSLAILGLIFF